MNCGSWGSVARPPPDRVVSKPQAPLELSPFRQRWPWIGPDLQTLRDTLHPERLPADQGEPLALPIGVAQPPEVADQPGVVEQLVVLEDPPLPVQAQLRPRGLVLVLHGLGGDSSRQGVRRLALLLQQAGFAVWRPNLRGAGASRPRAAGTYAAACNRDLLTLLAAARRRADGVPLLGVGLSLGGTVLLNGLLAQSGALDGLACVSSPLDLEASADQIEKPRNRLYANWLLRRLIAQTLADPFGIQDRERHLLEGPGRPASIRAFDAAITAPRWGYPSLAHYYRQASPLSGMLSRDVALPPLLLLHALDDPWVPVAATQQLAAGCPAGVRVLLPVHGGHNGFHGRHGQHAGSWADQCVLGWLEAQVGRPSW